MLPGVGILVVQVMLFARIKHCPDRVIVAGCTEELLLLHCVPSAHSDCLWSRCCLWFYLLTQQAASDRWGSHATTAPAILPRRAPCGFPPPIHAPSPRRFAS